MSGRYWRLFVGSLVLLWVLPASADRVTSDLIRQPRIKAVQLSPEGDKIGVVMLEDGKRVLTLMTLDPLEITYVLRFRDVEEVGDFYWVSNDRVVSTVWESRGWLDRPFQNNQLFAVNYNGKNKDIIFGFNIGFNKGSTGGTRTGRQEIQTAHANVISLLPEDRKHILIRTQPWKLQGGRYRFDPNSFGKIMKLNVYNGKTKSAVPSPVRGGQVFADDAGRVHFASGNDSEGVWQVLHNRDGEWVRLGDPEQNANLAPVGYSRDGTLAYLWSSIDSDRGRLVDFNLKTGEQTVRYEHPRLDIGQVTMTDGIPISVQIEDGLPTTEYLEPSHALAKYLRGFQKSFPGYRVRVESLSANGKIAVIAVNGDNLPTDYFLANPETKSASFLLSSADWLEPESLARTEAFTVPSRDGLTLQAYLTRPVNAGDGPLPVIVRPHGGPTVRDYWEYDPELQILANAGYAILSMNFRGSSGYGDDFLKRGYGHWGGAVQDDIADVVRWTVEAGYTDPSKVCIYGASFGAYSALMNTIRHPDLYRCAAGFAGVYDLEMLYTRGDIAESRSGRAYLKATVGEDTEQLREYSPVHRAGEVTVPVFIAHGGQDERAPMAHAEALVTALSAAGKSVDTEYYAEGGHGYFSEDANLRLYARLLTFFDKHLKAAPVDSVAAGAP